MIGVMTLTLLLLAREMECIHQLGFYSMFLRPMTIPAKLMNPFTSLIISRKNNTHPILKVLVYQSIRKYSIVPYILTQ